MNIFRCGTSDGRLDRQYLRVCAVYRLLKQRRIGKARALELLADRKVPHALGLIETWLAWPLKNIAVAA